MRCSTIDIIYLFGVFFTCVTFVSAGCEALNVVSGSCSDGLCESETGVSNGVNCYNRSSNTHICNFRNATPTELGVQIGQNKFQLPNAHFTASSNNNVAHYARIEEPAGRAWCAANGDSNPWLEIDLGTTMNVERLELESLNNSEVNFTVSFRNSANVLLNFNSNKSPFTSKSNETCHYVLIMGATAIRINPKSSNPCFRLAVYGDPPARQVNPTEIGVKLPDGTGSFYRIPDSNFDASSNREDAKYARIGLTASDRIWCAAINDSNPRLEIKLDGFTSTVERIEVQGNPNQSFTLSYSTNANGPFVQYRNGKVFTSTPGRSTFYIKIDNPYILRINSTSNPACFRVALYGVPIVGKFVPFSQGTAPVITTQPTAFILGRDSISTTEFLRNYALWAIFLAVFVFLLIFFLFYICCCCCRRPREFKSQETLLAESYKNHVPRWRSIDAKAEKGYIAQQEVQEVKIAFSNEYIPPDLEKATLDPNDEKYYRHMIFSFRGWEPKKPPKIVEPNKMY